MEEISQFRIYCVGHAAKHKRPDSDQLEVFLSEILYDHKGDVLKTEDIKGDGENQSGMLVKETVMKENTVTAKWLGLSRGNRVTPPDVRQGENVLIFKVAESDRYYWESFGIENDIRGKEMAIFMFGNTDNFKENFTKDNTYFLVVDAIAKKVHFHTSNNDGELVSYDLTFNTKDGEVEFKDSNKNNFILKSKKGDFTINTNNTVNVNTKTVNVTASKDVNVTAKSNVNVSASNATIDVKNTATVIATNTNIKSTTKHTGNVTIYGNLSVIGTTSLKGGTTIGSSLSVTGSSVFSATAIFGGNARISVSQGIVI